MQGKSNHAHAIKAPVQSDSPRVLVVEPDDDVRRIYRETLGRAGYEVLEALDGRDALIKALVRVPSLVVTELRLPFVDGMALCEILRRDRTTATVPILIITMESRPEAIERVRELADAVLRKPAESGAMIDECSRLLVRSDGRPAERAGPTADAGSMDRHRPVLAKSHPRFTTSTPPAAPPALTCPACDRPLRYEHSHVGGVSQRHPEQWDYYTCTVCGTFQYRQRTRRIRRAD